MNIDKLQKNIEKVFVLIAYTLSGLLILGVLLKALLS